MRRIVVATLSGAALLGATVLAADMIAAGPASANEFCDKELGPMMKERQALTERLNFIGKHGKDDPNARDKFCATIGTYIGNIRKTITYFEQNKDFCGIPDVAIDGARKGLAQNISLRKKVCSGPPPQAQQQAPPPSVFGGPGLSGPSGKPPVPRPPVELRLQ